MSVRLNPCHGCPIRKGCEHVDAWRAKVAGIGLRSAVIRCGKIEAALRPGTRIAIAAIEIEPGDGYHYETTAHRFRATATITQSSDDGRFSCVVDPEFEARIGHDNMPADQRRRMRFRKTMRAARIVEFLSEPRRALCECGNPIVDGGCDAAEGVRAQCAGRRLEPL